MLEAAVDEMQAAPKSLRGAGINIVAIHNHMLRDLAHFVFRHYRGRGGRAKLAQAIRAALVCCNDNGLLGESR